MHTANTSIAEINGLLEVCTPLGHSLIFDCGDWCNGYSIFAACRWLMLFRVFCVRCVWSAAATQRHFRSTSTLFTLMMDRPVSRHHQMPTPPRYIIHLPLVAWIECFRFGISLGFSDFLQFSMPTVNRVCLHLLNCSVMWMTYLLLI